jgi:hypothetical protein
MTDRLEDDTMMLDDWEEGRLERAHGKQVSSCYSVILAEKGGEMDVCNGQAARGLT